MLGLFVTNDGSVLVKGRSVKNKPSEPVTNHIGLGKRRYMKSLIHAYIGIGYTDYNISDLSELSLKQWADRKYVIPEGYMLKYGINGMNFRKITLEQLMKNLVYDKKIDPKSNPIVK